MGQFQKSKSTKVAVIICMSLVILSILISQQQVPALTAATERIQDKEYVRAIKAIGKLVPPHEVIAAPNNIPQLAYFTGHKVLHARVGFIVPVENFGRAIIEYMWGRTCSYLIVPEDLSFASEHPSGLYPTTKVQILDHLFEKLGDFKTETSIIHFYHLPSRITPDNIRVVTDNSWPKLSVITPVNGTTIESKYNMTTVNVNGTAVDNESKIKRVEVAMDYSSFKLTNLKSSSGNLSQWSISFNVNSEGTKRILVRATDSADHTIYEPVSVKIKNIS